jgi:Right handed beta helix region
MGGNLMTRRIRTVFAATVASLALLSMAGPNVIAGGSVTQWVDDDGLAGPSKCGDLSLAETSIQAAVDASASGDTILVCPGDYAGPITIDSADNLKIRGTKPWAAHVAGSGGGDLIHIQDVTGTRIQWLELRDAFPGGSCNHVDKMIVVQDAPDTQIRANHIGVNGTATIGGCGGYSGGIFVDSSDRAVVSWNRIVDFQNYGVVVEILSNAVVRGNTLRYNHVTSPLVFGNPNSFGILVDGAGSGNKVLDNVIGSPSTAGSTTPVLGVGMLMGFNQPSLVARGNRMFNLNLGVDVHFLTGATISGNRVLNSRTTGMNLLSLGGNSIVRNNVVKGSGQQGLHVSGTINLGAQFLNNDFRFNTGFDCDDDTLGGGTAGTANIWTNNLGLDDDPDGICIQPT